MRKLGYFLWSDPGFFLAAMLWVFIVVVLVTCKRAALAPRRTGKSQIDLSQFVQIAPGKGVRVFYVQMKRHGEVLTAGDLYLTMTPMPAGAPGCRVTAYDPYPKRHLFAEWQVANDGQGFTFWGWPRVKELPHGLHLPRMVEVGRTYHSPVAWVEGKNHCQNDSCDFGVYQRPRDLYTVLFQFSSGYEWGLIFSLGKKLPMGLHLIEP